MLNKRDTLRQEAASYFPTVLSFYLSLSFFFSSRPRIIVQQKMEQDSSIIRGINQDRSSLLPLPLPPPFFETFQVHHFRGVSLERQTRREAGTNIDSGIGVDTDGARNERRRSRLRHPSRNPGDETPWPSFVLRVPLLQG